jgi:threonine/homoserine/homoserine lactone efflux protein
MFVLGQSIRGGRRAGIAASLGIATGFFVHLSLVALGVAALLARHPFLFDAIRVAGALYLLWMAWTSLRDVQPIAIQVSQNAGNLLAVWREGTLVNVLNPKIIVFAFAFLPPFIRPENGSPLVQLLLLGVLFNLGGTLVNVTVAATAGAVSRFLGGDSRIARAFAVMSAAIFAGLAARILLSRA